MAPSDPPQNQPFIPPIPPIPPIHHDQKPAYELTFTLSPGNDIIIGSHTVELRALEDGKAVLRITYHKEQSHG